MKHTQTHRWLAATFGALTLVAAQAQTSTPADETVRLEKFDITDSVPIEEKILPTTRPFTSVYGDERSILDTPRNVTIVSREQLDAISIRDVRDFSKLTSSSYTTANFGAPANPSIRGLSADVFVNGIRRGLTSNGNGLPVNFNAVESVNIVKGPPTAVQGASQYTGGFVDLVTKRAYFDRPRGEIEATVGSWDQRRWTVDYGTPLTGGKSAVRFSYSGEDSGSYYQLGKRLTEAVYAAYSYHPSDNYQLDANIEYFQADYTENFGINRPTQDLIDHGWYIANDPANPPYSVFGGPGSTPGSYGDVVPVTGPRVRIDRSARVLAPGDDSFGRTVTAQLFQTWKPSAGGYKIVNSTTATWVDRDTFSSYIFSEVLKNHVGAENRTEVQIERDHTSINVGVSERFQNILSYVSYYNEAPNIYDLTQNPETRRFPADQLYPGTFAVPGEGARGNLPFRPADSGGTYDLNTYYNGGNGDTGHSQLTQIGVFYQQDVRVTSSFNVLFGGRIDTLNVTWTDPLPPPGYAARSDATLAGLPSGNLSLIYALTPQTKAYLTYNYSQSTTLSNGGGYVPGNGVSFTSAEFHRVSQLVEAGLKSSLLEEKLFVGVAAYAQEREIPTVGGGAQKVEIGGFEAEANYQPSRSLWATLGYSFTDSTNVGGGGVFGAGQTARPIDQILGGVLTPVYAGPGDNARYQTPGLPRHLLNALVTYKHASGFGASAGVTVTSPILLAANYTRTDRTDDPFAPAIFTSAKIPTQYTVDLGVFYARKAYEFRLSVLNATDEKNWSPQVPFYGNDGVIAEEPVSYQFTAKYRF